MPRSGKGPLSLTIRRCPYPRFFHVFALSVFPSARLWPICSLLHPLRNARARNLSTTSEDAMSTTQPTNEDSYASADHLRGRATPAVREERRGNSNSGVHLCAPPYCRRLLSLLPAGCLCPRNQESNHYDVYVPPRPSTGSYRDILGPTPPPPPAHRQKCHWPPLWSLMFDCCPPSNFIGSC